MERCIRFILTVLATLIHNISWAHAGGSHVTLTKVMVIGEYVVWIVRILMSWYQILEMIECICILEVVFRILLRMGHQVRRISSWCIVTKNALSGCQRAEGNLSSVSVVWVVIGWCWAQVRLFRGSMANGAFSQGRIYLMGSRSAPVLEDHDLTPPGPILAGNRSPERRLDIVWVFKEAGSWDEDLVRIVVLNAHTICFIITGFVDRGRKGLGFLGLLGPGTLDRPTAILTSRGYILHWDFALRSLIATDLLPDNAASSSRGPGLCRSWLGDAACTNTTPAKGRRNRLVGFNATAAEFG